MADVLRQASVMGEDETAEQRTRTILALRAERCDIRELMEVVARREAVRDNLDVLVARVQELNPRAAIAFDREDRSGSVS